MADIVVSPKPFFTKRGIAASRMAARRRARGFAGVGALTD
jgi:hypothetical protein